MLALSSAFYIDFRQIYSPKSLGLWFLPGLSTSSKTPPSLFCQTPLLNLQTVQGPPPFLGNSPPTYLFFVNPSSKNRIYRWTAALIKLFILNPILSLKSN